MGIACCSHHEPSYIPSTASAGQSTAAPQPFHRFTNQIHEITTPEQFDHIINHVDNAHVLIVCDFYAVWCPPCSQIAPIVHRWAMTEYRTSVVFVKIDVDQCSDLSDRFSIHSLPTFVLLKGGKEISRLTGADASSVKRDIDKWK